MQFYLSHKLENYIVVKQEEHYKSLNKNLKAKLIDIEKQKGIMEEMKGKTLTGLFRAERQKGERILEQLGELEQDHSIKNSGLRLTDKINEFESKNGELNNITRKTKQSSLTVNELFF